MDVVESNQQPLSPEVSGFVQTYMQMASLAGKGNAPLPPGEAVIVRNSSKSRTGLCVRRLHPPDKWKPLSATECREDRK